VPATVFGYLVEALRRRRALHLSPFTIASCDNLPGNGDLARRMFAAFADLIEPIEIADPLRDELMARAARQRENPLAFVRNEHLFGDLARRDEFASAYRRAVLSLACYGARETLRRIDSELGR
jgi:mannitol-1-phosphate/altronate dehydrogenase